MPNMVNLEQFVAETLAQIIRGVKPAQVHAEQSEALINPTGARLLQDKSAPHLNTETLEGQRFTGWEGQNVEFDVAATVSEEKGLTGGLGLVSVLGYAAHKELNSSSVSRIKFAVPVFLPRQAFDPAIRTERKPKYPLASKDL
jgi:hypothetical protein